MTRRYAVAALAALLVMLTACTGLPTSGQVYPGRSAEDVVFDPDIAFAPDGPQPGATPEEVVTGFIEAGSGPQGNWATAREFLTDDFRDLWRPEAGVTIDRLGDRTAAAAQADGTIVREVSPTGSVDADGAYRPEFGGAVPLTFDVVENDDGEWRIAAAPDGIVLYDELFRAVFTPVSLYYFDPTWTYLVPDVRWFPQTANLANYIVTALVEGEPSPWLSGAVLPAFQGVTLSGAVPTVDGVAQVQLSADVQGASQATIDRMQAQLEASLRSAGINAVEMTAGGAPVPARAAATRSTRVDSQSLVRRDDGRFGFLDGDEIEPVAGLSSAVEALDAVAVETNADLDLAAVLSASGTALRAAADGPPALLDERPGLLAPTIDTTGAVWTVPAGSPSAVRVTTLDGDTIEVADAWPAATGISAMRVSRDGTRVAAAVSVRGGTEVWVSGIRRSPDGSGIALGEPYLLAVPAGAGRDLAWLDEDSLGVLASLGGETVLRDQRVGGPGTDLTVPGGVDEISGGNDSARLRADDGVLYVRQGANWQQIADGVRVLAIQQGMP